MAQDLFLEINNAVLDLQASQLPTYERTLKKLAQLKQYRADTPAVWTMFW